MQGSHPRSAAVETAWPRKRRRGLSPDRALTIGPINQRAKEAAGTARRLHFRPGRREKGGGRLSARARLYWAAIGRCFKLQMKARPCPTGAGKQVRIARGERRTGRQGLRGKEADVLMRELRWRSLKFLRSPTLRPGSSRHAPPSAPRTGWLNGRQCGPWCNCGGTGFELAMG